MEPQHNQQYQLDAGAPIFTITLQERYGSSMRKALTDCTRVLCMFPVGVSSQRLDSIMRSARVNSSMEIQERFFVGDSFDCLRMVGQPLCPFGPRCSRCSPSQLNLTISLFAPQSTMKPNLAHQRCAAVVKSLIFFCLLSYASAGHASSTPPKLPEGVSTIDNV